MLVSRTRVMFEPAKEPKWGEENVDRGTGAGVLIKQEYTIKHKPTISL